MSDLLDNKITVVRSQGEWINGRYVKNNCADFTLKASVQPLKIANKDTIIEPGGRRRQNTVRIFTKVRLNQSDESRQLPADVIIYDGKRYEIQSEENWNISKDIPYYRYIAEEIDGQGAGDAD